jgi:menaquinone-dependent protoporphyrinogen oxidase
MRVLVTWGSKREGPAGIGRILSDALVAHGVEVVAVPAREVEGLGSFNAVIVGGALYANCWPRDVRHFVSRHVADLRKVPVWFFSSGPLDDSADRTEIPPTRQVADLGRFIISLHSYVAVQRPV